MPSKAKVNSEEGSQLETSPVRLLPPVVTVPLSSSSIVFFPGCWLHQASGSPSADNNAQNTQMLESRVKTKCLGDISGSGTTGGNERTGDVSGATFTSELKAQPPRVVSKGLKGPNPKRRQPISLHGCCLTRTVPPLTMN